jgi:stress-induced morphogen
MAMTIEELEAALRAGFPDAEVEVRDLAGDGDHYRAVVRSASFTGKSRLEQHKMVYAALQGRVGTALHALALETSPKP